MTKFFFFFTLFFHIDFPVKDLGKQAAQQDDRSQRAQFVPGFNDDGVQNLTADFEFQTQHDALRKVDSGVGVFTDKTDKAANHAYANDSNTNSFDEHDANFYKVFEVQMKCFHNGGVLLYGCDIIAAGGDVICTFNYTYIFRFVNENVFTAIFAPLPKRPKPLPPIAMRCKKKFA